MTKTIPQSVIDTMSHAAVLKLKLAIDIAMDHGGFQAVVDVCNELVTGAKATDRPVGIWAEAEWRILDSMAAKFPGSTANLSKYMTTDAEEPEYVDDDVKLDISSMPLAKKKFTMDDVMGMLNSVKSDPVLDKLRAENGGKLTVGAVANCKDISEADKTTLLGAMGIQYP